jgi:hypothetical protein
MHNSSHLLADLICVVLFSKNAPRFWVSAESAHTRTDTPQQCLLMVPLLFACRHAVLRQDEAAGQVLGLLLGLDAVKVLLPVEPVPVQAPAPDGGGATPRPALHSPIVFVLFRCAGGAAL